MNNAFAYIIQIMFLYVYIKTVEWLKPNIYLFHKYLVMEASLFMAQGGQYAAEWAKFFRRAFCSGRIILAVCFVVGEKFWSAKNAEMVVSRAITLIEVGK